MMARVVLLTLGLVLAALPAAAQSDRIVALVITVGDGATRADAIQTQLQLIGAETLRSDAPNAAELRSILTRFAREAAGSRATFVYLDVPVVDIDGRSFVLPDGAALDRPTDLFTQAIPLQAFSRSAAQAAQGGTVMTTIVSPRVELPSGLSVTERAPDPVPASSPVLVADTTAFGALLAAVEEAIGKEEVEVGALLRQLADHDGVTISDFPKSPIHLSEPPQSETLPDTVVIPEPELTVRSDPNDPQAEAPAPRETLEELTLLERSLSRAAKRAIQRTLRTLGLYKGLVDGIFGPQTRAAIKGYKISRSEPQTGVLNRRQLLDLSS